jgi:aspartate racemase
MRSPRFREEFAKHGVAATGPSDEAVKAMAVELITDLQRGRVAGASERLGKIAKISFQPQFRDQRVVCLACTELPLALEKMKTLAIVERDGIVFINSTVVHINAAFNFAVHR